MSDLVAFLRGRLDEDEQTARDASSGPWVIDEINTSIRHCGPSASVRDERWGRYVVASVGAHDLVRPSAADAAHIVRHDPARVLAEVDAKRAIITEVTRLFSVNLAVDCGQTTVLKALALPYAGHADYREEWRP